jgi:hypothetical protein
VIIVTNALKQFITWNLKDEFLPCEASALFLQVGSMDEEGGCLVRRALVNNFSPCLEGGRLQQLPISQFATIK